MRKKHIYFLMVLIFFLPTSAQGSELSHTFLFPIYNGAHQLPILASGDVDADGKPEVIIGSEYQDCVTIIEEDLQQSKAPKPFSYLVGKISVIAIADLNHNGTNEMIIGHKYISKPKPSIFIIEKINGNFQIIWESGFLGVISRYFVQDDKVIAFVDDSTRHFQQLCLLQYEESSYKITDSLEISGFPVYLGPIGNLKNALVICSKTKVRGPIFKFGSYVNDISLKNCTLIDFSTGHFKTLQPAFTLPGKDIWDLECYDLNQDGQDELILGAYDDDISIVEIYQWTPKGYDLVFTAKTPSKCHSPKGLILIDHDGNQIKEVLTVDGIMVHYNKDHFVATNFFSQLHIDSLITKANILACDLNQDNIDEIVLFVARDTEDFQLYNTYEAYYLTTPAQ